MDDQILEPVEAAKRDLVKAANDAVGNVLMVGSSLVGMAQNVASREALAHVQIQYRNVLKAGAVGDADWFLIEHLGRLGTDRFANASSEAHVRSWISTTLTERHFSPSN